MDIILVLLDEQLPNAETSAVWIWRDRNNVDQKYAVKQDLHSH
jgi:hypothetical protein